jgi:hypothetical protein
MGDASRCYQVDHRRQVSAAAHCASSEQRERELAAGAGDSEHSKSYDVRAKAPAESSRAWHSPSLRFSSVSASKPAALVLHTAHNTAQTVRKRVASDGTQKTSPAEVPFVFRRESGGKRSAGQRRHSSAAAKRVNVNKSERELKVDVWRHMLTFV